MGEASADAHQQAIEFGAAILGRLHAIQQLRREDDTFDLFTVDQAEAGARSMVVAAVGGFTGVERVAFAAGMICGASELADAVRLGLLRGLLRGQPLPDLEA
jgi:hypothetical protein